MQKYGTQNGQHDWENKATEHGGIGKQAQTELASECWLT